ncbi:MAG: hypothetical protein ACQEXJ_01215 [Myxococcota bacterium]
MTNAAPEMRALHEVREALIHVGYAPELLVEDYTFADYLGEEQRLRSVGLGAFGESPTTYRSACLAVQVVGEDAASPDRVVELRGFGASKVISLSRDRARVWTLEGAGEPTPEEEVSHEQLGRLLRTNPARWSPEALMRAKDVAPVGAYQMEFADLGLLAVIEGRVHEKLDRLLRSVIHECSESAPALLGRRDGFQDLVRLVLWLITAKVLSDREHPDVRGDMTAVREALSVAGRHYGVHPAQPGGWITRMLAEHGPAAQQAWDRIRAAFHFQNLSVDALALIYEGTLVDPEVRAGLGVHATPRPMAEMVTDLLPLEALPPVRDEILELCAGFGPFLMAAMRRLRSKSDATSPAARHEELVRRLRGIEIDPFAVEVARLCLTLADYPNSNGWNLEQGDVFAADVVEDAVARAGAVFGNPPFERFQAPDHERYRPVMKHKATELLRRVIEDAPPPMLGMVLPPVVLDGPSRPERDLRVRLAAVYDEIDTVRVPDRAFAHSDVETVLLVARGASGTERVRLRSARVAPEARGTWTREAWREETRTVEDVADDGRLWVHELAEMWRYLEGHRRLGDIAVVHQGIEYKRSLAQAGSGLVSEEPRAGMRPGVLQAGWIRPYAIDRTAFLCESSEEVRRGGRFPWDRPKALVNAARRSRGPWCLSAAPDREGLLAYQRLHGVWPRDAGAWRLEVLCAVLNGPVANAWIHERAGKRDIQVGRLKQIPLPDVQRLDIERLVERVGAAEESADPDLAMEIDAEILKGYDLPPRMERRLLQSFHGERRPGFPSFDGYYPPGFDAALPLHEILALEESQTAGALLRETPVFDDPAVTEMFERMAEGFRE